MTSARRPEGSLSRSSVLSPERAWQGELTVGWVAVIIAGHGVYGLLLARSAALVTVHALMTFAIGIWFAMTGPMRRVAVVCAYMAGSEVLWRLGHASLPWEFVKYGICVLVVITLSRIPRLRWDWPAVMYFALLVPSTLMSFSEHDFAFARQQVSFNISGPLVLAASTWFFAFLKPSRADAQRMFVAVLAPVMSLALIALTKTASLGELSFSNASNFQTSAGYGPNQVSTVLGFGVLLALLLALMVERGAKARAFYSLAAVFLGIQSAMTFSRGGLLGALGALLIASPLLLHGVRSRMGLLIGAVALVAVVETVVLPRLDELTGGALVTRFSDTNPTGRDELIRTELESFTQHPIFGTGPAALDEYGEYQSSAHTEFTRLLAQHGVFGALALSAMLLIGWRDVSGQLSREGRALSLALIAWSLLTMTHAAMRLALAPFAFGMAAALFFPRNPALRVSTTVQERTEVSAAEADAAGSRA